MFVQTKLLSLSNTLSVDIRYPLGAPLANIFPSNWPPIIEFNFSIFCINSACLFAKTWASELTLVNALLILVSIKFL